jgi:hypothetical protein
VRSLRVDPWARGPAARAGAQVAEVTLAVVIIDRDDSDRDGEINRTLAANRILLANLKARRER